MIEVCFRALSSVATLYVHNKNKNSCVSLLPVWSLCVQKQLLHWWYVVEFCFDMPLLNVLCYEEVKQRRWMQERECVCVFRQSASTRQYGGWRRIVKVLLAFRITELCYPWYKNGENSVENWDSSSFPKLLVFSFFSP